MTQPKTTTRIPAPLYAAAGAGELAYQQLLKLPAVVNDLGGKAVVTTFELREKAAATLRNANATAVNLRDKATATDVDVERLREAAMRNAAAVVAGAQAAQERAVAVYGRLVAHGERVVGTRVVKAADIVDADIEATEAPAEVTAAPTKVEDIAEATTDAVVTPADVAERATAKPTKRTRTTTK
ncbi:hypothetical protein [Polymorphospora rubra]|uniref:hypothetical protein n=1 Tax=Polymorphospora rubra TaxID=338584 RepID=UPI0033D3AC6D